MSRRLSGTVILVLIMLMCMAKKRDVLADQKRTVGWLEKVNLPEYGFSIKAKIDTGAKNSSIHAVDVEYIEKKGKAQSGRIRFKTVDLKGKVRVMEADVIRQARIKKSGPLAETRPEIELEICLAGIRKRIQVNLTDREEMNYRMILGRTALEGDFIVDVSKKFTVESDCPKKQRDNTRFP